MFVRDYMKSKRIRSNKTWHRSVLCDGLDDDSFTDAEGDRWSKADEYGDRAYVGVYVMDTKLKVINLIKIGHFLSYSRSKIMGCRPGKTCDSEVKQQLPI